eukprot:CAMPEP_0204908738 /NCGR_PEP_ID=MMETSP1397-20131031/7628_1 /ASSEMBLY_ACC=CAM_ASM_000891 /TAXON_ID=49980 /ORGANISM="Climacostomum Climacostomum virens, Strain Stock W-24" /LENGTH=249 /DNA_ID=CAMNT_0052078361 /DNA_START=1 /DNA_END=747 /DNA_ORIENTATION=+
MDLPPTISYSDYSELRNASVDADELFGLLRSPDWRMQFDGLNLVRVLNKFQWEYFLSLAADALPILVTLTDSPRSQLSKNALTAIGEIFIVPRAESFGFVGQIVPILLLKAQSEKSFLKKEAHIALEYASENCVCEALIEVLVSHCTHKSGNLADTAFHYLEKALPKTPEAVGFYACASLVDSKRKPTIKGSVNYLRTLQTSQNYDTLFSSLDPTTQAKVTRALEQRPTEQTSLRDMMRQAREASEAST